MLHAVLFVLLATITVFGLTGVVLMVRALRDAQRETSFLESLPVGRDPPPGGSAAQAEGPKVRRSGLGQRARHFVRRSQGNLALFGPARRVVAEFVGAAFGFPGLGWILSGRVTLGVTLFVGVPAVIWALFPMVLSVTGHFGLSMALKYVLPGLAGLSAGALAVVERRGAGVNGGPCASGPASGPPSSWAAVSTSGSPEARD